MCGPTWPRSAVGRHDQHLPRNTREIRGKAVQPTADDDPDDVIRYTRGSGRRLKDDAKKAKKGDQR